jgi:hypothetical protein
MMGWRLGPDRWKVYDLTLLHQGLDHSTLSYLDHLVLHRSILEISPNLVSTVHPRLNMPRMVDILIQLERIVSHSLRLNREVLLPGTILPLLPLGLALRVVDPTRGLHLCMTRRLLVLSHSCCLEDQTRCTIIHHQSLLLITIDLIGSLRPSQHNVRLLR